MHRYLLISSLFYFFILSSCSEDFEPAAPDVSAFDPQFEFIRFEQELWALDTNNIISDIRALELKYPHFTDIYFNSILLLREDYKYDEIEGFLQDSRIKHLQDTTQSIIGSLVQIQDELYKSFQYYQYYFPNRNIANIYTFISEYTHQTFIFDDGGNDGIGLGLDMFLGKDYPYRNIIPNNPAFSEYLTRSFNKAHMTKKVMETIIVDMMGPSKGSNLLDMMIHNGKKIYILNKLIPFVSDTVIMEYSSEQLEWCFNNEIQMWGYFLAKKLFYSNDLTKINKLINPSPHSKGMPPEAPGRTANFIGWQIIESYMKRYPDKSLEELIGEYSAQEILELSKYKPRRM